MATPAQALPDPPGRPSREGGVEDRYRSLFAAGRGGMGTVEVALERGTAGFDRVVALKRLLPEQARDPRHKQMFLREARLAALLRHPNVVHAFAFGEIYGELFLAMEYVEGATLASALATSAGLDAATAAFILAEVCEGLHAAHELRDHGGQALHVVHRDVSPQNVMMAYDGHVKILDFGVAKFDAGGHDTRTGEVKGKMAYMSPEQALGEPLDRRSDLYSVGAVLFECLTGKRMWGTGTDLEVMRRLALEEPPRLSVLMPDAPEALASLHARLVARDSDRRPATAAEVARELRAFASKWPAADAASVAAMMRRLFAGDIDKRRRQLNEALEAAAPARVDALRSTLDLETGFGRATLTEPVIVRSDSPPPRVPARGPRARRIAGGAAILALATAIVGGAITRPDRATPAIASATSPAVARPPSPSATAAAATTPSAPATPPPMPIPASSVAPPSNRLLPARRPTRAPPSTRSPLPAAPPPPPPPTPTPPDVDPTPF